MAKLLSKTAWITPANLKQIGYVAEDGHEVIRITDTGAGNYVEVILTSTAVDENGNKKLVRYTSDDYVKEIAKIIKPFGAEIDPVSKTITHNGVSIGGEVKSFLAR